MTTTRSGGPLADGASRGATDTPLVILGLAGLSMSHGALGAIRSAGRLGVEVFHAHPQRRSPLDSSRYSSGSLRLPESSGGSTPEQASAMTLSTLEILLDFGATRRRAPLLLAVDDASALFVEAHAERLRDVFRFPHQSAGLAKTLADKRRMASLCAEYGVPTPLVRFPESKDEVLAYAEQARFPVVAKRIDASLANGSTAPNVLLAANPDELVEVCAQLNAGLAADEGVANVMLQEYIPAAAHGNWVFNGYFDARSECRLAATGLKLRQAPPRAGAATLGLCHANPLIATTTIGFLKALSYRGLVDADYRLDSRDGQYKLLDVNPRIGASFRLFAGEDGSDVLRAMYFDLTGDDVLSADVTSGRADRERRPAAQSRSAAAPGVAAAALLAHMVPPRDGRRWVVEPQDLRCSLHLLHGRDLTARGWLRSLRGVQEAAWWARDDPRPFFVLAASLLRARLRRGFGGRALR